MKRTSRAAAGLAAGGAALAFAVTGCSALSPATVTTPYPPSDGVSAELPGTSIVLRNFLVVGTEKGAPAAVVGNVVNQGDSSVTVTMTAELAETTQPYEFRVTVPANDQVLIAPNRRTRMIIPELTDIPGGVVTLSPATTTGSETEIHVPVVAATGPYESLTAPPATTTPTPTGEPTEEPTGDPTEEPTEEPTE